MDGKFVPVDGLSIFTVSAGKGAPILFLHGNTGSSRWFSRVMDIPGHTSIAIDMPNFGRSSAMPGQVDLHRYADAVAAFITAEKLEKPVLVGHSLGGAVAMSLAVRRPELIASLVLVDSSAPYGLVTPEERYPLINAIRTNKALFSQVLAATVPTLKDPQFMAALVDDAMAMAEPAWIGNAAALSHFNVQKECASFTKPVLILWGRQDSIVTEQMARDTQKAFPDARLEIVDHVGHSLPVEDPALFIHYVADFIRKGNKA